MDNDNENLNQERYGLIKVFFVFFSIDKKNSIVSF